ncbi:hypothetical protein YQE_01860, partial [Dendroctonus ponderosae]
MRGHKKTKESGFFEGDSTETEVMTNTLKRTKVYTTSGDGRRIVEYSQEDSLIPSQNREAEEQWKALKIIMILMKYTADLAQDENVITPTFADDTAILISDHNPITASQKLQTAINKMEEWLTKWRVNEDTCVQVLFTMKRGECPPITINNTLIKTTDHAKYLGMHLDRRLTWKTHKHKKRKELDLESKK